MKTMNDIFLIKNSYLVIGLYAFFQILFMVYILLILYGLFFRKKEEIHGSSDWKETYLPYFIMIAPMLLVVFPRPFYFTISVGLKIYGFAWAIASLAFLRKYFSIEVEIRGLQVKGPYRIMRHPLYYGEAILIFSEVLNMLNPLAFLLFLALVVLLVYRAYLEEKKFLALLPEYEKYKDHTPSFSIIWFCVKKISHLIKNKKP